MLLSDIERNKCLSSIISMATHICRSGTLLRTGVPANSYFSKYCPVCTWTREDLRFKKLINTCVQCPKFYVIFNIQVHVYYQGVAIGMSR